MEYKDFCEKYDTKDFEKLAREYTKMYGAGVNVLSNSENKTKNFLQAYENLLDILFELCKNIDKNFEKLKYIFTSGEHSMGSSAPHDT